MKKMVVFGTVAIMICGLATLLSGAQARAGRDETTVEKSLSADGSRRLDVEVFVGAIHVYVDSPDTVRVRAVRSVKGGTPADRQRWLKETRVDIVERDGVVQIKDVVPEDLRKHPIWGDNRRDFDTHLNVELHMPRHLALQATSLVGDVEVDGQAAELKVKSTAGNIRLKRLQCAGKSVDVKAGAGNIALEGQVGNLTVTDGAGTLDLSRMACSGDQAEVKTGAGNVNAAFSTLPGTRCRVDVGAGNVVMNLPAQIRTTLQLKSGMGNVRSAFNPHVVQRGHGMGDTVTGDVNGGGAALDVHVGIGNIRLEKAGDRGAQVPEAGGNDAKQELRAHRSAQQDVAVARDDDDKDQDGTADQAEKEAEAAVGAADKEAEAAERTADSEIQAADRDIDRADNEMEAADKENESNEQDAGAAQDRSPHNARTTRSHNSDDARSHNSDDVKTEADDAGDIVRRDLEKSLDDIGDEVGRQFKDGFPGQNAAFSRQIADAVRSAVTQALQEAAQAMDEGGRAQQEADQAVDNALRSLHDASDRNSDQNRATRQDIESARRASRNALTEARRALRAATREIERALRDMPQAGKDAND